MFFGGGRWDLGREHPYGASLLIERRELRRVWAEFQDLLGRQKGTPLRGPGGQGREDGRAAGAGAGVCLLSDVTQRSLTSVPLSRVSYTLKLIHGSTFGSLSRRT